ncbi:valine--tRNA ligase [Candidatus Dependentiae bacterium]|nr:MAG: valine--tRNA ligase [Candidatus Dependentiae bacterium]
MEKKYDYKKAQELCRAKWLSEKTYQTNANAALLYAIDTPPPTVSGTLHIGHVFSYTQTDIIARHKRMEGRAVFYPFGFDDNGLPTERYVEKKCNVRAHEMKRGAFIDLCLTESAKAADTFKDLWQNLGISAEWEHTYSTISVDARRISQQSFLELYAKDLVYRRYEPALYCTACRTSVAQAELDDAQLPAFFTTISFTADNGNQLDISTTRPELLPACVALLFHPNDTRYTHLYKTYATAPLFGSKVPILSDEKVDPEKGTGLVMVCTFGDTTDIEWYKKHNLPYIQAIGLDGKMTVQAKQFAALSVNAARTKILETLEQEHLIKQQRSLVHNVGVHERCKTPVEYMLLAQWFVRILPFKKDFIAIANTIDWKPAFMKSRYVDWVEHLQWDWCISRQRMYGIPFPVWHCADCNTVLPATMEQLPVDPQEMAAPAVCTECKGTNIVPDQDVMDTWNTSSLTPYLVHDLYNKIYSPISKEKFIPMALRPQAHDIIRTWAFDTIVKSLFHEQKAPWQAIVISGHVLSEKNEKISKSKGNETKKPEALLEEFCADAIRYWTASGSLGHDVAFSVDQIKQGNRLVTKLWNAFLFAYPHVQEVKLKEKPVHLGIINEWLLHELTLTEKAYHQALNVYEFGAALQAVEQFFWSLYCDNYIELVKHSLFNPDQYDQSFVQGTRWTLYAAGLRLLQLYAPYIPFVTEAIFQELYAKQMPHASVHQTQFATIQTPYVFEKSAKQTGYIMDVATSIRKLKTGQQLSLKTALVTLTIQSERTDVLDTCLQESLVLKGVTQAIELCFKKGTVLEDTQNCIYQDQDGQWHAIVYVRP